jgi:hypothetical protein
VTFMVPRLVGQTCKFMSKQSNEPPEQDPRMGDKTPAYVEWMFKHKPEEAKKLYAGRKVMGVRLPLGLDKVPQFPKTASQLQSSGDIPESSMAKEEPEQWLNR